MLAINYNKIENHDERYPDLFRLRYQVYCDERGFEDPLDYPDMIERDEFDDHSVHFCNSLEGSDEMIGTVRMILYSGKGFPIEKNFILEEQLLPTCDRTKIAEISRLAISKALRRKAEMRVFHSDKVVSIAGRNGMSIKNRQQKEKNYVLGLYNCIYKESLKKGLTHWYASMTEGLCSLLSSMGCVWHPIGPRINYHGFRRPYIAVIGENAEAARRNLRLL